MVYINGNGFIFTDFRSYHSMRLEYSGEKNPSLQSTFSNKLSYEHNLIYSSDISMNHTNIIMVIRGLNTSSSTNTVYEYQKTRVNDV